MRTQLLKPLRIYDPHDVIDFFSLDANSGDLGQVVQIAQSGYRSTDNLGMADMNAGVANVYTPRMSVKAKVSFCTSGVKPFGMLLQDIRETNFLGVPMIYDSTRKAEANASASGEAVPIVRKGVFLYYLGTGCGNDNIVNSGAAPSVGGKELAVTNPTDVASVGRWLGTTDKDGYALLSLNAYN